MVLNTIAKLKSLKNKRVLLRVDFNIPLGKGGKIGPEEDAKIRASLPTIEHLLKAGAKVIAVSHLGRPKKCEEKYSLAPVAKHLTKLLGKKVLFVDDCLEDGEKVEKRLAKLGAGELALLENIRYYPQEEKNDKKFAKRLAGLADIYVNDAFATCHRAHASTEGVAHFLPAYAGLLVEKEVASLDRVLKKPKKPFIVLMGGAKISSKLPTLKKMLAVADKVLIGGAMANAFFKAMDLPAGKAPIDKEDVKLAKQLLKNKKLILPTDVLAATGLDEKAKARYCPVAEVKPNEYILDIGALSIGDYAAFIKSAQTIVWNGPLGLFEVPKFAHGTVALGRIIAARSKGRAFGVVGGGETIAAVERTGMAEWVDHISTGGGAMLEYLSGKPLPGIKALMRK
ncbi:MAG: phosphoglycerate kinase [Patescibacteria group bacterium]|nr:phosphoglycerate kinase [Patescibacteria group bacterium]